jgi:hypothetical protein
MKQVFPMIPAGSGPYALCAGIGAFLLLFILLFAYLAWTSRHASFEISPGGLAIHGGLYGRLIPAADLDAQHARATDLTAGSAHALSWRTNGVGFPGYASGWFQLQDGERALAFVTDKHRVVYIPTRKGYSVLLSVADPEAMVRALQQSAGL